MSQYHSRKSENTPFITCFLDALAQANYRDGLNGQNEPVAIGHDESGDWYVVSDSDSITIPSLLLMVYADGTVRNVPNNPSNPCVEDWRK